MLLCYHSVVFVKISVQTHLTSAVPGCAISVTNTLLYSSQKNKKPQGRKEKGKTIMEKTKINQFVMADLFKKNRKEELAAKTE